MGGKRARKKEEKRESRRVRERAREKPARRQRGEQEKKKKKKREEKRGKRSSFVVQPTGARLIHLPGRFQFSQSTCFGDAAALVGAGVVSRQREREKKKTLERIQSANGCCNATARVRVTDAISF
jgi:hypothetical protein